MIQTCSKVYWLLFRAVCTNRVSGQMISGLARLRFHGPMSGSRMPLSLVVDDEPAVRGLTSAILREEGFQTLEASDGTQALQIVLALEGEVDLIVSDIQMPNGDGLSL